MRETIKIFFVVLLMCALILPVSATTEFNNTNWNLTSGTMLEHGDGNLRAPPSVWDDIVGFWSPGTDVGSGTVLKDLSGNGNDGTIYGATWNITSGMLEYNGTSDYVDCGNDASLALNDSFSILVKMNCPDQLDYPRLVEKGSNYYFYKQTGIDKLNMRLYDGTTVLNADPVGIFNNITYDLAFTWDRTDGVYGYKNNDQIGYEATPGVFGSIIDLDDHVVFGSRSSMDSSFLEGSVGNVYIHNIALTNDQINETRDNYHNITSYMETDSPIDAGAGFVNMYVWFNGTDAGSNTTIELQVKQNDTATWETAIADVTMNTQLTIPAGMLYQNASFRWYANTSYQPETDVVESVTFEVGIKPPVITLLSQTPSIIYENSTGYLNISYGISHSSFGLNNTSISFIYRNYDPLCGCSNHSIRPPANDLATEWDLDGRILRAANRNESLNFENNASITGGNTYDWSGLDENSTRLTIVPVNSTYTLVYINGSIHDIMPQSWYLDRSDLQEAPKTQIGIHKTQNVLVKLWNLEIFKGNYDYIAAGYTDTDLDDNPALHPSDADPLNYYYVSSGYDPDTDGDPLTSGYAVYMGSGNASEWVDYVYSPHANSNYVRAFINNTLVHQYINTTNISYVYFTSNTPSSKPFYINVTDVSSSTNVSFADTKTLWAGDTTLSQQSYTPNMWFAFMKANITFDHMLYVSDNKDTWSNSTLSSTEVVPGFFPPTTPTFYSFHNGYVDYDMNGTYYGTIQVQIGVASDPDGGNVTHNMTLHYSNGTLIEVINNASYPANGVFTNVSFNTTPHYSQTELYTLRLVATDDEGESVTTWLGVNFSLDGSPNIISYSPESPVSSLPFAVQQFSIVTNLPGNVTWYINGTEVYNETNVSSSSYSNNTAGLGVHNVTVNTTNEYGTNSMEWEWSVETQPTVPLSIYLILIVVLCGTLVVTVKSTAPIGIVFGIISLMLSFFLSKVSINGQLVETYGYVGSGDTIITGVNVIQVSALAWLFAFVAIISLALIVYHIINEIRYQTEPILEEEF